MSKSTPRSVFHKRFVSSIVIALSFAVIAISIWIQPSAALTNGGSITTFETPLTENFDVLANTGTGIIWTNNSTIPGWYSSRAAYNSGTGSSNAGALYSFGVAGTNLVTDRALGSIGSGSTGTIYWGVKLTNNTGATITSLDVSYVGEQWRNGGSSTNQPLSIAQTVDFQYQIANAGLITGINNPTTGWIDHDPLDFTSPTFGTVAAAALDGNAGANRVAKSATLSIVIGNGQEVWLRWTDIDHTGNDHALAIDDFSVTAHGAGPTNPTGVGASNPSSVLADGTTTTRLTVTVTPGTSPVSTGLAVSANLTPIGGIANQTFYDDGSNGDQTAGDNIFSFTTTVAPGTSGGNKSLNATVSDAQARSSSPTIPLTVLVPTPPTGTGTASPSALFAGDSSLLTVNVTPGTNPTSTGLSVTADLSSIGGSATQTFSGSGNTFTFNATVTNATTSGTKMLPFTITDLQGRNGSGAITVLVKTPVPPNDVVISQVYGGGGNTGADFKNDFIELINRSTAPVNLNGWSVQVFVSGSWVSTPLPNFTLQPGQYFLIQESQGAGGTDDLPTPDATGTILMPRDSSKVALVNNTTLLTLTCPESDPGAYGIVDFVGYGATDCSEGSSTAPLLDNLTADFRRNEGCFDTNDNSADFVTGSPNPRNSSSPTHDCTTLFGFGIANPSSVPVGGNVALTVDVSPAQNPTSTGITVMADLSAIGGSSTPFGGSGNIFTFNATVSPSTTGGFKSLPVTISDGQGRSFNTNIVLSVLPTIADHITISEIYGGGGNSGATYKNDFVELYNPTNSPVSVTGWSIQYGSATGTNWTNKQPIGGMIGPNQYYLISLGTGTVGDGAALPASQIYGGINMSATAGKVALVKNSDSLAGPCPLGTDPDIVDFVGYGSTANCHEGTANAPAPSNTTAVFRKNGGSQDTDQNGNDFTTATPNPRQTAPIVELGPWVAGTDPTSGGNTAPHDATVTVDFSEAVDLDAGWYDITCASTGLHNDATVAHTNDFKTYAITPNSNFQFGEQCTVTITKTAVHDQDLNDSGQDTDTLFADYIWSFTVVAAGQAAPYPPSVHLTMGDPGCGSPMGCAAASMSQPDNFLMQKPTYSLSYNRDKGTPNWVSWHLEPAWYGTLARVDTFRPDPAVDPTWYRVQAFDYSGSGFDRGHMTPNADRDNQNRIPINQETYLMSNMVPQAPDNNQGPWAALENYLRTLTDAGSEIYIVSGPAGQGGTGSNGFATTIANNNVTVPESTWKVALVLPKDNGDDISRVDCRARTIAVIMPNIQGIRNDPWENYLKKVDDVEALTGYDFFSNLPAGIQRCVEAGVNGTNPPGTADQSASTAEDTPVTLTLQGFQANNNTLTFTITGGPSSGSLGTIGTTSCSNGICTADVTYSPTGDYNGSDSFTFKVNDGTNDSGQSTFTLTINPVNDTPIANAQSVSTDGNTPVNITLTGSDVETPAGNLTFTVTSGPSVGTLSGTAPNLTYTPGTNACGGDSFKFTVTDTGDGSSAALTSSEATVSITVKDTIAPTITLTTGALSLSPPNHTYRSFTISDLVASASDYCDSGVDITDVVITKVTSDELEDAPGSDDGSTLNDIVIAPDCKSVQLRAERNGTLNGRVYTITLKVADSANNVTTVTRQVTVPISPGVGAAIDSGPKYTVNSSCP